MTAERVDFGLVVLCPVYDDWESWCTLLGELDQKLAGVPGGVAVVAVNDGSRLPCPRDAAAAAVVTIRRIEVLDLTRNLGHQRAIAIGLVHVAKHYPGCDVVVMDSDGEDPPEGILSLRSKAQAQPGHVVFAGRAQRHERLWFRAFYAVYKRLFRWLTGERISFGNFSLVPAPLLPRLLHMSELWSHYSAAVIRARLPRVVVPMARGRRYAGSSHMRLVSLVAHGLSAATVFPDTMAVRLTLMTLGVMLGAALGIGVVVAIRVFTDLAIPGWATSAVMGLSIVLFQALIMSVMLSFLVLSHRTQRGFIPAEDCPRFVEAVRVLHSVP